MAMLGNKALTRRPVRAADGTMLAPMGSPLQVDPLAPLPAGGMPGMSNPPSSLLSVLDQPSAMAQNVPQPSLPQGRPAGPGYERPTGWRLAAGIFADALSGAAGQPGMFAATQERRRQEQTAFERGEQQYRRQREDSMADYRAKKDIDAQYPNERAPYRWEANNGSLMEIGPNGLVRSVYEDPTPKMQAVQGFDADGNPVLNWVSPPKPTLAPPTQAGPRIIDRLPPGVVPIGQNGGAGSNARRPFP